MEELRVLVQGPVDVEFATLFMGKRIVGRFEITILGPEHKLHGDALRRWARGEVVIVGSGGDRVGLKRRRSYKGYGTVYVYFRKDPRWVGAPTETSLMNALSSCGLKAPLDFRSPPPIQ